MLEWLGESYNPGPVGTVGMKDAGHDAPGAPPLVSTVVRFGLALVGLIASSVGMALAFPDAPLNALALGGGVYTFYLLVAGMFDPRPDTSNLGWAGGLIDDPFRYSDDLNRSLLSFKIALFPGRVLAGGVVDMFRLIASR